MRRALLTRLPAFSHFYGLHPWDIERLTMRELSEYVVQYDRAQQEQQEV